ncbi:DUF4412 domain-containing protein [Halofilum ochraceum]|uniref:DUF4412 domain-containing protein n=1 Tax=Halofilum ochraceum TaxID=1611323 RepID=UPI00082A03A5|nr:DUF4412 domain-containing protein [Halofilum ochraceum]
MQHRLITLIAGLGVAALSGTALADTTLTYKSRDGETGMVYSIVDDGVSLDNRAAEATMLYDISTKTFTMIDHGEKTYTEVTEEARQQMQQQMTDARKQSMEALKDQIAGLPKEAREKILKGTQAGIGAGQKGLSKGMETRVERTGRMETVNGYECEVVRVGVMFSSSEICLADNAAVGMPASASATMEKMNEGMRELSGSIMQGLGASMPGGPGLEGIAVRITSDGTTWHLSDLSTGNVDPAAFQVPNGYEKQDIMLQGN